MSQMVQVSTVSTGRELLARYASTRRAFFPPVPPRRYKPPRPEPTIVYATPITIDRPISPRIVYDAPLIIHAPHDVDLAMEEASIAKMLGKRIRVVEIIAAVSDHFGVRRSDIIGHRRARIVSRPRQVAMYLSKELTDRSLPEIGRLMGGKDHTTILHGYRQIWKLLDKGHAITRDVLTIRARLLA